MGLRNMMYSQEKFSEMVAGARLEYTSSNKLSWVSALSKFDPMNYDIKTSSADKDTINVDITFMPVRFPSFCRKILNRSGFGMMNINKSVEAILVMDEVLDG